MGRPTTGTMALCGELVYDYSMHFVTVPPRMGVFDERLHCRRFEGGANCTRPGVMNVLSQHLHLPANDRGNFSCLGSTVCSASR